MRGSLITSPTQHDSRAHFCSHAASSLAAALDESGLIFQGDEIHTDERGDSQAQGAQRDEGVSSGNGGAVGGSGHGAMSPAGNLHVGFPVGARVRLRGLQSQPHLNDLGTLSAPRGLASPTPDLASHPLHTQIFLVLAHVRCRLLS